MVAQDSLTEKELNVATVVLKAVTVHFIKYKIGRERGILVLERVLKFFKESHSC